MKKRNIKLALFSLAGFAALSAFADEKVKPEELTLVEDLPVEQRVIAHEKVVKYLDQHPEIAKTAKYIAVDKEGNVYVLDETKSDFICVGNPSCISAGN